MLKIMYQVNSKSKILMKQNHKRFNNIIDDILLIKKLYKLADNNDLLDEQWDL